MDNEKRKLPIENESEKMRKYEDGKRRLKYSLEWLKFFNEIKPFTYL